MQIAGEALGWRLSVPLVGTSWIDTRRAPSLH